MIKLVNLLALAYLFVSPSKAAAQPPQYFTTATTPEEVGVSTEHLRRLDGFLQGYVDKGIIVHPFAYYSDFVKKFRVLVYQSLEKNKNELLSKY